MLDRIVNLGYGLVKPGYSHSQPAKDAAATMDAMGNSQGARIKSRREARDMSRTALAKEARVSRQSIIKWEESKTTVEISRANLRQLAQALKCSEEYILHGGPLEGGPKAPQGLDSLLLAECLEAFQEETQSRPATPQRATEIIAELYEMWDGSASRPPKDVLRRFIRRRLLEG